jgi:hypothetical protein
VALQQSSPSRLSQTCHGNSYAPARDAKPTKTAPKAWMHVNQDMNEYTATVPAESQLAGQVCFNSSCDSSQGISSALELDPKAVFIQNYSEHSFTKPWLPSHDRQHSQRLSLTSGVSRVMCWVEALRWHQQWCCYSVKGHHRAWKRAESCSCSNSVGPNMGQAGVGRMVLHLCQHARGSKPTEKEQQAALAAVLQNPLGSLQQLPIATQLQVSSSAGMRSLMMQNIPACSLQAHGFRCGGCTQHAAVHKNKPLAAPNATAQHHHSMAWSVLHLHETPNRLQLLDPG